MRNNQRLEQAERGRAEHKDRQRKAKKVSDKEAKGSAESPERQQSRSQSRSPRGEDGKGGAERKTAAQHPIPSESDSEEFMRETQDSKMGTEPNASIEDIMQKRLDDFMMSRGKAFVGEMVKSMVSGLKD